MEVLGRRVVVTDSSGQTTNFMCLSARVDKHMQVGSSSLGDVILSVSGGGSDNERLMMILEGLNVEPSKL